PNLSDILLYHVVSGTSLRVEDFTDGFVIDPITTGTFTINTTGGIVITDAGGRLINLLERDITAMNGVLHSVDNVLLP
ncbi:MAG: fasciclin domain-containing protein, partial [Nonlabens sp.]|nr:fasciclin domain-containing protein [Nonlabens sp.]